MPMRMCPAAPLAMAPISRLGVLDVEAHALGPALQHLPGSCEADSAAGFLEQGNAAVFFEPPHAAREGWLRTMQPRRRAAHMLQLGKGLEVAEVAQVHSKSYFDGSPETMDWTVMVPAPILNAEGRPATWIRARNLHSSQRRPHARFPTTPSSPCDHHVLTGAFAQAWPARPIRLVVPFPPGGGTDIIARSTSQAVAAATGWTFVVDNKPGAGGNLGVDAIAKSKPDGYTIVIGQTSNLAINPTLYAKMPYDSQKDLAPIVLLANAPLVMVTGADSPLKTVADAVNAAKAKPPR